METFSFHFRQKRETNDQVILLLSIIYHAAKVAPWLYIYISCEFLFLLLGVCFRAHMAAARLATEKKRDVSIPVLSLCHTLYYNKV